ncbi:hypothetical protein ITJ42_15500 [Clavibacter michiganensis subsp. phaseoli]|uniref:DUF2975 domain-containing protein n=1 Tax=Clavibacter phaseoli TaxID=1734031 RepID=A0A8I0SMT3_9MICO|nr:hypothetical protein [Clavibacter phaseoli]MBF4632624.1 hypothetical protein [Clavibacter phaseoli]
MASTGIIESRPVRERPRVLRITRFVLLLVMTATVIGDTSRVITTITGHYLFIGGGADPRLPLAELPQLREATLRPGATGSLADADLLLRVFGAVPSLVHGVTVVLAVAWLLRALRGIAQAQPFHAFVVANWRRLALTLLIGGALQGVSDMIASTYLAVGLGFGFGGGGAFGSFSAGDPGREGFLGGDYSSIGSVPVAWPVDLLLAGLIALALTASFRAGARLAEDADGVV